jgi:hypothetical protein
MSKQDIEKRLGFAAQGVKETTRTIAKAEMGFLSRVGYAATALTADPADPKSPEYRKQVSEAKAAAKDAITNYKFMRDKVKERLAALDAYVTNAIKVINSATSAKDIEHYVEQLRIAVKSQSMILGASKSPFSRASGKAAFAASLAEIKAWAQALKKEGQLSQKVQKTNERKNPTEYDITSATEARVFLGLSDAVQRGDKMLVRKLLGEAKREISNVVFSEGVPKALIAWANTTTASRPGAKADFATMGPAPLKGSPARKEEIAQEKAAAAARAAARAAAIDEEKATIQRKLNTLRPRYRELADYLKAATPRIYKLNTETYTTPDMKKKAKLLRLLEKERAAYREAEAAFKETAREMIELEKRARKLGMTLQASRPGVKAKFGTDSISVNMIAKRMVSKLKKIVPNEGLEQFHKRLLARINEIVKSTEEAIRNPDDANLQWTIQELKDVIRDEAGSSGSLNRATGVWLGSRPGVKAKMAALYSIEVVDGGSVTSTMDPEQFRAWAVKNVPGISRNDFVPTMIEKFNQMAKEKGMGTRVRIGNKSTSAKAKMAAEIASDPRDKDFEKLKTLKGVVHQGKGFYIIPNKLMTPERRTKVKRSTQRYELSNMGDLVGWGTNHPNVNDYRLKDWAEAFA